MTGGNSARGFSLLEMVVAIFLIAIVLAFSLAVMGRGMGVSAKSNDLTVATAITEEEMERIKNIPFPPTTIDRQDAYVDKNIQDAEPPYNNDFQIEVSNTSYLATDFTEIPDSDEMTIENLNNTMLRRIVVNVYRKRDSVKLVTFYTYIARNGKI